jgi:hypothetical protein
LRAGVATGVTGGRGSHGFRSRLVGVEEGSCAGDLAGDLGAASIEVRRVGE